MRNLAPVSAMLPAAVSSACPLLPDEAAGGVLMASLTAIPGGSAWVPLEVNLSRYMGDDGGVRRALLDAALCAAVEKGEQGHDAMRWSCAAHDQDSKTNRRLAIFVRGWGDVVARRGLDPESLATLRDMERLANHVVTVLTAASRAMAERNGYCPALDVAGARVLQYGREMNARWRRAVGENAVRHRNLLTMSPWDVFPRQEPADFRFRFGVMLILVTGMSRNSKASMKGSARFCEIPAGFPRLRNRCELGYGLPSFSAAARGPFATDNT
jgi:hypothetical protein